MVWDSIPQAVGQSFISVAFHRVYNISWESLPVVLRGTTRDNRVCGSHTTLLSLPSNKHGSAAEFEVFHLMTRILDATNSLCFPLPPGESWLFGCLV